ncbi:hypothetical protein VOLCADRAFT_90673 [Volvox carteri f. nagariensis]|uniref:C-type lectin domain-containing protein n=1 Tax=Volvox carteri f. nagariensis TaxID=3068 RepID=D8TVE9_VOLCA|nr:uncharacterized protein VOLCADRAFT_90673 [Volvox carteri f. nagariensis]EFJ48565.1 hypothetical protein VOLCADRAFT_90673 [Volvox carteri f. nagariensis]|eukprot:XP_002950364.1 hypothetical protein VOLCADRAFT_90673 [Volvox carteri f. nagariensis]
MARASTGLLCCRTPTPAPRNPHAHVAAAILGNFTITHSIGYPTFYMPGALAACEDSCDKLPEEPVCDKYDNWYRTSCHAQRRGALDQLFTGGDGPSTVPIGKWLFVLDTAATYTYPQAQAACSRRGMELAPLTLKESTEALSRLCEPRGMDCWYGDRPGASWCPMYDTSVRGGVTAKSCTSSRAFAVCAVRQSGAQQQQQQQEKKKEQQDKKQDKKEQGKKKEQQGKKQDKKEQGKKKEHQGKKKE